MGNGSSNESKFDNIAANYILSQTSNDINNMTNLEYCNKLVILTSKIIKNESGGAQNTKIETKEEDVTQPKPEDVIQDTKIEKII